MQKMYIFGTRQTGWLRAQQWKLTVDATGEALAFCFVLFFITSIVLKGSDSRRSNLKLSKYCQPRGRLEHASQMAACLPQK